MATARRLIEDTDEMLIGLYLRQDSKVRGLYTAYDKVDKGFITKVLLNLSDEIAEETNKLRVLHSRIVASGIPPERIEQHRWRAARRKN